MEGEGSKGEVKGERVEGECGGRGSKGEKERGWRGRGVKG